MTRVRFAPSPTGRLHLGNARGALINWLYARQTKGVFLLRLDDTDRERSTAEFAAGIEQDMRWLGLEWDEFKRQSDRMDRYALAAEGLKARGLLYPCYETPAELEAKRARALAAHKPPIYDRASLNLSDEQRAAFEAEGRKPHWRFKLPASKLAWTDLIRGPVEFDGAMISDPVLVRADGTPVYTLASVVDDIELGITHVIRGEDHVANTAVQIALLMALGGDVGQIAFAHFTLLTDAGGGKLSKRLESLALVGLRAEGIEPMAINSLLARLGTSEAVEPAQRLDDLVAGFGFAKFSRAAPKLDTDDLRRLNAKLLHGLDHAAISARLAARGLSPVTPALWEVIRGNIATLDDVGTWRQVALGPLAPVLEDAAFAAQAAEALPPEPWDAATWGAWTKAVGTTTGRKGRALYHPLRLALTAREDGPELKALLPLIGHARATARLRGKTA